MYALIARGSVGISRSICWSLIARGALGISGSFALISGGSMGGWMLDIGVELFEVEFSRVGSMPNEAI